MSISSGLRSGLTSGLQSGLNPGGAAYTGYTDATSGKRIPQSAADYTSLRTAYGLSISNPDQLNPCQNASGNLTDVIGAFHLVPSGGTEGYQAAVTGWSLLAATCASGVADNFSVAGVPDVATVDQFAFALLRTTVAPGANRTMMYYGAAQADIDATGPAHAHSGVNVATGAVNFGTTVHPVGLMIRSGVVMSMYTDLEIITPTLGTMTGTTFFVGGVVHTSPALQILNVARWSGANAITTTADVRNLYTAMGWSIPW